MKVLWIITILILLVFVSIIFLYNRLVSLRQICNQAWSDINVQLKQRLNLIPNLIETVKGYTKHERETLNAVVEARQRGIEANNLQDQAVADHLLTGILGQLLALSEAYPDLKASQNFLNLQQQLLKIEDKISAARRFYNDASAQYNATLEQFPSIFIAKFMSFKKRNYYQVDIKTSKEMKGPTKISF